MMKKRLATLVAVGVAVTLVAGMAGCASNSASVADNTQTAAAVEHTVKSEVANAPTKEEPTANAAADKAPEKITVEEAKAIILADLGVTTADFVELDSERDDNEYEFEVVVGEKEYDYDVNFFTGKIVDKDVDRMDAEDKAEVAAKKAAAEKKATDKATASNTTTDKAVSNTAPEKITLEKAKEIALADLGISNAKLVEKEFDDGKYELEFWADGVEYKYEISAKTGKIVDKDVDRDDRYDD